MNGALAPIADKLGKLLRMLSSDRDGEVISAARAITRTLESVHLDIHVLANSIEIGGAKKFSEAEAHEIYKRGVEDGRKAAQRESGFHDVGEPSWHSIACECAAHPERLLSDREREFVDDMVKRTVLGGQPTEKQAAWLRKIYARSGR